MKCSNLQRKSFKIENENAHKKEEEKGQRDRYDLVGMKSYYCPQHKEASHTSFFAKKGVLLVKSFKAFLSCQSLNIKIIIFK